MTIDSEVIHPAQETDVNVWLSSNSGDSLNSFSFEFRITTAGATRLEFVDPQPHSQLTNPSYVFYGNSGDLKTPVPVGLVTTTITPNDTFIGGDFTYDNSDVQLSSMPVLLATLRVTSRTALPAAPGDTFTVSATDFEDLSGPLQFSDTPGTITIIASAVPEPSSFVIAVVCGGVLLSTAARARRRSRR